MLSALRITAVRGLLVIFLMALSTIVAVERAQAVINDLQHELAIEHSDPALELAAADDHHDHAAVHDHDHEDRVPDGDRDDGAPGPHHHHHAEGPQVAALSTPALGSVCLTRSEAVFARVDTGSPRSLVFGLERPPKSQGEDRA